MSVEEPLDLIRLNPQAKVLLKEIPKVMHIYIQEETWFGVECVQEIIHWRSVLDYVWGNKPHGANIV